MKKTENKFYAAAKTAGFNFLVFSSGRGIKRLFINPKSISTGGAVKLHTDDPFMFNTFAQLDEYFLGTLKKFDIPLDLEGTDFQKKVWKEISRIPFGKTVTYKEIALKSGGPALVRAVGGAVGANPVPIIIPCHRVIGSSGSLTGYSAGLRIKEMLLEHEGIISLELFTDLKSLAQTRQV